MSATSDMDQFDGLGSRKKLCAGVRLVPDWDLGKLEDTAILTVLAPEELTEIRVDAVSWLPNQPSFTPSQLSSVANVNSVLGYSGGPAADFHRFPACEINDKYMHEDSEGQRFVPNYKGKDDLFAVGDTISKSTSVASLRDEFSFHLKPASIETERVQAKKDLRFEELETNKKR